MITLASFPYANNAFDELVNLVLKARYECCKIYKKGTGSVTCHFGLAVGFLMQLGLHKKLNAYEAIIATYIIAASLNENHTGNSAKSIYEVQEKLLGIMMFRKREIYKIYSYLHGNHERVEYLSWKNLTTQVSTSDDLAMLHVDSTTLETYNIKPGNLREKGRLKNNSISTCIKVNSTTLPNGMCVTLRAYPGNQSDQKLIVPTLENLNKICINEGIGELSTKLISFDKGYGSFSNLTAISNHNFYYLTPVKFKNTRDQAINFLMVDFVTNYVCDQTNSFLIDKLQQNLENSYYRVEISEDCRVARCTMSRTLKAPASKKTSKAKAEEKIHDSEQELKDNIEMIVDLDKRKSEHVKIEAKLQEVSEKTSVQKVATIIDTEGLKLHSIEVIAPQELEEIGLSEVTSLSTTAVIANKAKPTKPETAKKQLSEIVTIKDDTDKIAYQKLTAGISVYASSKPDLQGLSMRKIYTTSQYPSEFGHKQGNILRLRPFFFQQDEKLNGKVTVSFLNRNLLSLIKLATGIDFTEFNNMMKNITYTVKKKVVEFNFTATAQETFKKIFSIELRKRMPLEKFKPFSLFQRLFTKGQEKVRQALLKSTIQN